MGSHVHKFCSMQTTPMKARQRVRVGLILVLPSVRWITLFVFAFGVGFIYVASHYASVNDAIATEQLSFNQLRKKSASGNWYPARFERSGVLAYDAARAQPGYTLYALAPDLTAHLIDMDGRELHRWSVSRKEVMPEATGEASTLFGMFEPQVEGGHLFSNGDLLLVYEQKTIGASDTTLVKLNKDSQVLWKTQVHTHHAVEVVKDRIYALTGTLQPASSDPGVPNLAGTPYIDEGVSILDRRGIELSTHSILEAMANTKNTRLADAVPASNRLDPLHSNSLDVLTEQTAHFIPGAKPGNVLLSLRNLDMLVVMDLESETIVWALRGSWRKQHDAKMLPNGHILLFDNQGGLMKHGRSRVLEIDPRTASVVWSFCGTDSNPLDSEIRGGAQRLIGGNTLISESTAGRILEVTPDGSTVWEYVSPLVAAENGHKLIASLGLTVTRYDPTYVSFLDGEQRAQVVP